ncbi:hypothetical protein NEOKW01_0608 [Nematocida sp. AWRm80]|nr:hypothetical protein NEOKW01_0608 [Nematocida sp. AWRm80]
MNLKKHFQNRPKILSWEEISQHNSKDSCWIVLSKRVYDITDYLKEHPGGANILIENGGKDCTEIFMVVHPWINHRLLLERYYIGTVRK